QCQKRHGISLGLWGGAWGFNPGSLPGGCSAIPPTLLGFFPNAVGFPHGGFLRCLAVLGAGRLLAEELGTFVGVLVVLSHPTENGEGDAEGVGSRGLLGIRTSG